MDFLWGYVKDRVYTKKVNDVIELRHRIEQSGFHHATHGSQNLE
jgi:hypothetical protein